MHFNLDVDVLVGLLVGIIGAIAIVVGATAAIEAVSQAKGRPPTADEELLPVQPMRLSMIVAARGRTTEPLHLRFTLTDPALTLLRIELANQLDVGAPIAECINTAPKVFVAEVEPKVIQRWYNASPYWDGETKQLPIRVFLRSDGQAACRTIWVTMSPIKLPRAGFPNVMDFAWLVEGPC